MYTWDFTMKLANAANQIHYRLPNAETIRIEDLRFRMWITKTTTFDDNRNEGHELVIFDVLDYSDVFTDNTNWVDFR